MDFIKKYISSIVWVKNKKTDEQVKIISFDIRKSSLMYSNTKTPIYRIVLNDEELSKHNCYKVCYKCITCQHQNIVNIAQLVRKLNKSTPSPYCNNCKNNDTEKTETHSKFMKDCMKKGKIQSLKQDKIVVNNKDLLSKSVNEFSKMDSDFIDSYFIRHMTKSEYLAVLDKIISIQKGKFKKSDISTMKYCEAVKINNQTLFNPYLYDVSRDCFEKIAYIRWKCEKCDNEFENRDLYIQKNKTKIFCKDCSFCNRTFKIRNLKNIEDENVTWQSQFEKKFILFCNSNNIIVKNGPKIGYRWNDIDRRYIVDFYLPQIKLLVELKDDHHWHKKQVENGMWKSKEDAACDFLKTHINEYNKFNLVFPSNYVDNLKYIKTQFSKI